MAFVLTNAVTVDMSFKHPEVYNSISYYAYQGVETVSIWSPKNFANKTGQIQAKFYSEIDKNYFPSKIFFAALEFFMSVTGYVQDCMVEDIMLLVTIIHFALYIGFVSGLPEISEHNCTLETFDGHYRTYNGIKQTSDRLNSVFGELIQLANISNIELLIDFMFMLHKSKEVDFPMVCQVLRVIKVCLNYALAAKCSQLVRFLH